MIYAPPIVIPAPRWRFWPEHLPKVQPRKLWKAARRIFTKEGLVAKAVVMTALTSGNQAVGSSATTASITPTANALVLLAVFNRKAAPVTTPTASGNDLAYTQIATVGYSTIASNTRRTTLFRAQGESPTAGAITIDFGGVSQSRCQWSVAEFTGVVTTTPIVQSQTNRSDAATGLTVTLGAFGNINNATYGCFSAVVSGVAINAGAGFTEIHDIVAVESVETEWRVDNDTTVDADTGATSGEWAGIAVEIMEGVPTGSTFPAERQHLQTAIKRM